MLYRRLAALAVISVFVFTGCEELLENDAPGPGGTEVIDGDISDDITWEADVDYVVTDVVDITGELTVEPGTRIEFEEFAGLRIKDRFTVEGTEDDPIMFTGTEETPGHWMGLWVRQTEHPGNSFDHVIVEYGGADSFHDDQYAANLAFSRSDGSRLRWGAEMALTNTTLRYSGGHGLSAQRRGDFLDFEDNTFVDNEEGPVSVCHAIAHQLDDGSEYTDNGTDAILVHNTGSAGDDEMDWEDLGVPYRLHGTSHEFSSGRITIHPGVTVEFEEFAGLRFTSGTNVRGTEDDPILFTGTEERPGHWRGLWLRRTTNSINSFEHIIVEYAGQTEHHAEPAGLTIAESGPLQYDASVEVHDSLFRNNDGYGIVYHDVRATVNDDIDEVNEFENNAEGEIYVDD